jgi:nitroreductase
MSMTCGYYPKCGCPGVGLHCSAPTMEEAIALQLGLDTVPTEEEIKQAFEEAEIQREKAEMFNSGGHLHIGKSGLKRRTNKTPPKKRRKR